MFIPFHYRHFFFFFFFFFEIPAFLIGCDWSSEFLSNLCYYILYHYIIRLLLFFYFILLLLFFISCDQLSLVVSITDCHHRVPGSIPTDAIIFINIICFILLVIIFVLLFDRIIIQCDNVCVNNGLTWMGIETRIVESRAAL